VHQAVGRRPREHAADGSPPRRADDQQPSVGRLSFLVQSARGTRPGQLTTLELDALVLDLALELVECRRRACGEILVGCLGGARGNRSDDQRRTGEPGGGNAELNRRAVVGLRVVAPEDRLA
jgi:hypothetical protein